MTSSTFLKRRKQLSIAGAVGKALLKRIGLGTAVLGAVAGLHEAKKQKLFTKEGWSKLSKKYKEKWSKDIKDYSGTVEDLKKKKVQKKATGGEIVIGKNVDKDLL